MKKGLQKILLLIAVITVTGHSILPHFHHDETPVAIQQHHQEEEQPAGHHHHDDNSDNTKDNQHGLFSFAQLDEDFIPANAQIKNFELPAEYLIALIVTYLSDNYPVNTKTQFGCYIEFPPPDKYFSSSSHRGPPQYNII